MSDLETPYEPQLIYYSEADAFEFVSRDVPTVAQRVMDGTDLLLDLKTREQIGFRIAGYAVDYLASLRRKK